MTASLGLAFFPSKDIVSAELLVKFADEALYQAKRSGRNNICLYQAQNYRYEVGQAVTGGAPGCIMTPGPLTPGSPGHQPPDCRAARAPGSLDRPVHDGSRR